MKKTLIILLTTFLFLIPIITAQELLVNTPEVVANISSCEGPVIIDMRSDNDINPSNLKIDNCIYEEGRWSCNCEESFFINLTTSRPMNFDLRIYYYLQHSQSSDNNDVFLRSFFVRDLQSSYENITIPDFNIDYRYFYIIPLIIILSFIYYLKKKVQSLGIKKVDKSNYDDLNYSVEEDKDIQELLDKIK